ncbi:MAG: GDP-mannose 4,6-dehydratase [Candidatus Rokubacteria bacterium]|nr:GDP-mannose 4,6-dehydratase [Candidatus Rokubacteria bacterium]
MDWTHQTVTVTGAGGFIGSHLTECLVRLGARTRAFVHYNADGRRGWLDQSPVASEVETIAGDVRDPASLQPAFERVDIVFHLAALIGIPYSYVSPVSYVRTNIEGTLNVLDAARRVGARHVVHTSTSETYGTARYVPIDEQHAAHGQSPYAASKIGADQLALSYFESFAMPVTIVRPFNTFGPRQSPRAVIPAIITQALARREVRLGSLTPSRDLTFVADTVAAFVKAAESAAAVGETFNVGTGSDIAVGDLASMILRLVGVELPVVREEQRVRPERSEVWRLVCDASKARAVLGWRPALSLEAGLMETIEWFRACPDAYATERYHV